jgi:hypothetical protein
VVRGGGAAKILVAAVLTLHRLRARNVSGKRPKIQANTMSNVENKKDEIYWIEGMVMFDKREVSSRKQHTINQVLKQRVRKHARMGFNLERAP